MTQEFDPYVALGLAYGVTDAEIKAAYRKLVKKYHPDFNSSPQASEKMNMVIEAYRLLSDPEKKKMFDQEREKRIFGRYQQQTIFDGIKSFVANVATDLIDDFSQSMQEPEFDPSLLHISNISSASTKNHIEIKVKIPTSVLDIWRQDKEYWIEQLLNYLERDLTNKI